MLEQAQLAERFQVLLEMEEQARRIYADLATQITEPAVLEQVQQILKDKQRHVRMAQRLLEIVESA